MPLVGYVLVHVGLGPAFVIIAATNSVFSVVNLLNRTRVEYQVEGALGALVFVTFLSNSGFFNIQRLSVSRHVNHLHSFLSIHPLLIITHCLLFTTHSPSNDTFFFWASSQIQFHICFQFLHFHFQFPNYLL